MFDEGGAESTAEENWCRSTFGAPGYKYLVVSITTHAFQDNSAEFDRRMLILGTIYCREEWRAGVRMLNVGEHVIFVS
jgi:hypothetical protein